MPPDKPLALSLPQHPSLHSDVHDTACCSLLRQRRGSPCFCLFGVGFIDISVGAFITQALVLCKMASCCVWVRNLNPAALPWVFKPFPVIPSRASTPVTVPPPPSALTHHLRRYFFRAQRQSPDGYGDPGSIAAIGSGCIQGGVVSIPSQKIRIH